MVVVGSSFIYLRCFMMSLFPVIVVTLIDVFNRETQRPETILGKKLENKNNAPMKTFTQMSSVC